MAETLPAECDTRDGSEPTRAERERVAWIAVDDASADAGGSFWRLGQALIEAKAATAHGRWLTELAARGIDDRRAQRLMHVARRLSEPEAIKRGSLRELLADTGSPVDGRAQPIPETVIDGEEVSDGGESAAARQPWTGRHRTADPWPADSDDPGEIEEGAWAADGDADDDAPPGALTPDGPGVTAADGATLHLTDADALDAIPEAEMSARLVEAARWGGWRVMRIVDARKQVADGWPDLTLVRAGEMMALELKTAQGALRPGQAEWLEALDAVPGITARLVRPADLNALIDRLTNRPPDDPGDLR